jgi:hypothetical protein
MPDALKKEKIERKVLHAGILLTQFPSAYLRCTKCWNEGCSGASTAKSYMATLSSKATTSASSLLWKLLAIIPIK